jgi:hypothetical protein
LLGLGAGSRAYNKIQGVTVNYELTTLDYVDTAVFEVAIDGNMSVFMKVVRENYSNDESIVVIVDADKFLKLWRENPTDPDKEISHGYVESWKADRKYSFAEEGFSRGQVNPVPLPDVSCTEKGVSTAEKSGLFSLKTTITQFQKPYFSVCDGMTRIIWLLSNNAKEFPVLCQSSVAGLVYHHAGVKHFGMRTVDELIPLPLS